MNFLSFFIYIINMIFPVKIAININTQIFLTINLFNIDITKLYSIIMIYSSTFPKILYDVLSILRLNLLAKYQLLSDLKLALTFITTLSSVMP